MHKNTYLALATTIGSAICWWPCFIWQDSQRQSPIPALIVLAFIALLTCFSTILSHGRWVRFWLLSSMATFFGVLSGGAIWPSEDGIAQSYLLFGAIIATFAVLLVALIAGLAARFLFRYRSDSD